jgi:hypothetical protein
VGLERSLFRLVAERNQPGFEVGFDRSQRLDVPGQTDPEHARPRRAAKPTDPFDAELQGRMSAGDNKNDRFHVLRARIVEVAEKRQGDVDAFRIRPPGIWSEWAKPFDFLFHPGAYRLTQIDRDEQPH